MNTLSYPALLIVLAGIAKLLTVIILVVGVEYLIFKGLFTTKKMTLTLEDKKSDKIESLAFVKNWGFGVILMVVSYLLVNLFATAFTAVYAESYVIYILTVNAQCIATATVFGLMSMGMALVHMALKSRHKDADSGTKPSRFFVILTKLTTYALTLFTILPIVFFLIEVFVATGK